MLVPIRDMKLSSQDGSHVCVLFSLQLNCQLRSQRLVPWLAWGLMQEVLLKRDGIKIRICLGTGIIASFTSSNSFDNLFCFHHIFALVVPLFKIISVRVSKIKLQSLFYTTFFCSHYVLQTKSKQREQSNTMGEAGDHRVDRNKKWKSQNHSKAEKKNVRMLRLKGTWHEL